MIQTAKDEIPINADFKEQLLQALKDEDVKKEIVRILATELENDPLKTADFFRRAGTIS